MPRSSNVRRTRRLIVVASHDPIYPSTSLYPSNSLFPKGGTQATISGGGQVTIRATRGQARITGGGEPQTSQVARYPNPELFPSQWLLPFPAATVTVTGGGRLVATRSAGASSTARVIGGGAVSATGAPANTANAVVSGGGSATATGSRVRGAAISGGGGLATTATTATTTTVRISGGGAVTATHPGLVVDVFQGPLVLTINPVTYGMTVGSVTHSVAVNDIAPRAMAVGAVTHGATVAQVTHTLGVQASEHELEVVDVERSVTVDG